MWLVALVSALSLLTCTVVISLVRKEAPVHTVASLKRAPWELIPFILSMFVVVESLHENGVTDQLYHILDTPSPVWSYGITSFLAANLINNIPMSVLYSNIIQFTDPSLQNKAIYSTIIGSNLGAFLTPVGALAGIMFTDLVEKQGLKFSFKSFVIDM